MKRNLKSFAGRALSLALCAVMALALLPGTARAATVNPAKSTNINKQEYVNGRRWASTVKSYLYANSIGGLTRVEYADGKVIVEDYDNMFRAQASRTIQQELPIWGGFYAGKDYNFLVFGQENKEENDNKEVIRIVKYSKSWQRLGSASLYGANTIVPFDAGSLRCDEYNGYLYIRTCHKMYTSKKDGLNHQANVMINVRQSDMKITDSITNVMSVSYGYVSHSFNQFVLIDQEKRIVALDHGDASSTRGAVLLRYGAQAGQDSFMEGKHVPAESPGYYYTVYVDNVKVKEFPQAAVHYNDTGAALGGFAETTNGYVTAYNFDGTASDLGKDPRDIYLAFTDKNLSNTNTVKVSGGFDTSVPQLASTGLDGGYIMWNGRAKSATWYTATCDNNLYYAHYDANGKVGSVQRAVAPLSDCAPVYWNGKVVWYVTNNSVPMFYTLTSSGVVPYQAAAGNGTVPANIAYANTQTVLLDGRSVTFQTYALKDSSGGVTNYIKLRDMAYYVNGTNAQFSVDWQYGKGITLATGKPYVRDGSELSTPFSGDRTYKAGTGTTTINSNPVNLASIVLTDNNGGAYTYYKLRDMGRALGFNVSYINGQVVVNTNEAYSDAQ